MAADPGVKPAPASGEIGRGGNRRDEITPNKARGASAEYLVRRLKRDHPEIAEALARGEYPSARAAAIAAGVVRVPTLLDLFARLWAKASPEEQDRIYAAACRAMEARRLAD